MGLRVPRQSTSSRPRTACELDVNEGSLHRPSPYSGQLLAGLSGLKATRYPTDRAVLSYLAAQLTRVCGTVYAARILGSIDAGAQLSSDDKVLVAELLCALDFIKHQHQRVMPKAASGGSAAALQF